MANLAILVIDTLILNERAFVEFPEALEPDVSDSITTTESVTIRFNRLNINVSDTLAPSDVPTLASSQRLVSVAETITTTESVSLTISRALTINVHDTIEVGDFEDPTFGGGGAGGGSTFGPAPTVGIAMNPAIIDPLVVQDIWGPTWLVDLRDIATAVLPVDSFVPSDYRLATLDLENDPTDAIPYNARIVDVPTVSRSLRNTFWGTVEVAEISFSIANADGFFTEALYTNDIRGRLFTLTRYDWFSQTVVEALTVTVSQVTIEMGKIVISGFSPDLSIFEQKVPSGTVTVEIFGSKVVDLGATIPVVVGSVEKMPIPYVHDGVDNNTYDYLIGVGTLTVRKAYRDSADGTMVEIHPPEYKVRYDLYPGYTVIRFPIRQINFFAAFHKLFADVDGMQPERNFARMIRTVLTDTTFGLGQTVDDASFTQAEADITALGLLCDGALLEQAQAQDVLNELMIVRGMRLGYNATGDWTIAVDKLRTTITMPIGDGVGDNQRNILNIRGRQRTAVRDAIAQYILHYRLNFVEGTYEFTQQREVTPPLNGKPLGQNRDINNAFIRDHVTADKVIDYLAKREIYGAETVAVVLTQEARGLVEGDLVQVTHLPMGFDEAILEVRTVNREQETLESILSGWSAAIYVYTPGTLPEEPVPPDTILRIPRPGGLELLGPPANGCDPFQNAVNSIFGQFRLVGQANGNIFTGRDVRIRWHQSVPLTVKGLDEDNFDPGTMLVRDYLISVIGIVSA